MACGAISGFHRLVSSGTSSKQLKCESDAQFVGYGSMLTEGFLATLVILKIVKKSQTLPKYRKSPARGKYQGVGSGRVDRSSECWREKPAVWMAW